MGRKPKETKYEDVFEALGFDKEESAVLHMKCDLMEAIEAIVKKKGYSRADLRKLLDVPAPRVSELMTGRIDLLSIEKLLVYLEKLNARVNVNVHVLKEPERRKKERRTSVAS